MQSNNIKLVHWPLMGGLLHFGTARSGLSGASARPGSSSLYQMTNVTVHPSTASVPITALLSVALRFYCTHKWLITSIYLRQGRFVCYSFCVQPRAEGYAWIYMKFLQKVGITTVTKWLRFCGDPNWPSLLFRGHSRPARSFRHKIDCSA